MPIYSYKCEKCEEIYDIFHTMSEKRTICEKCGEEALIKLLTRPLSTKVEKEKRVGSIVENYIEKAKEEIKLEKDNLKKREMK